MCEHYIAITLPEEQEAAVFPGGSVWPKDTQVTRAICPVPTQEIIKHSRKFPKLLVVTQKEVLMTAYSSK